MRVDSAHQHSGAFSAYNFIHYRFWVFEASFTIGYIHQQKHSATFTYHIHSHASSSHSVRIRTSRFIHILSTFGTNLIQSLFHTTSFNADRIQFRTQPTFTNSFIQSGPHSITYGLIQSRHIHSQPHSTAGDCAPTALPTFTPCFIQ